MKLNEAINRYHSTISILKKGHAQERYRANSIAKSFLGDLTVDEITSVHIASYRDSRLQQVNHKTLKSLSPSTVRLELSLLSNFFDIARIEWGICTANPVKDVRKPKPAPARERRLTPRESRLLLRRASQHKNAELLAIIVLALETAMRQGEILKLRWENINLKTRIAHLPETKNGSIRDVPLTLKARDTLIAVGAKPSGPVFSYTANGFKSTWRYLVGELGINDLHFHDLRHEAISRLFELGSLGVMDVAAISGHKSLSMLKRYTHLKAQKLVKKLDNVKNKGLRQLHNHLVPYPAIIERSGEEIRVRILDFDDVSGKGCDISNAITQAQSSLLKKIVTALLDGNQIPCPDHHLEPVDERAVVMISPV